MFLRAYARIRSVPSSASSPFERTATAKRPSLELCREGLRVTILWFGAGVHDQETGESFVVGEIRRARHRRPFKSGRSRACARISRWSSLKTSGSTLARARDMAPGVTGRSCGSAMPIVRALSQISARAWLSLRPVPNTRRSTKRTTRKVAISRRRTRHARSWRSAVLAAAITAAHRPPAPPPFRRTLHHMLAAEGHTVLRQSGKLLVNILNRHVSCQEAKCASDFRASPGPGWTGSRPFACTASKR